MSKRWTVLLALVEDRRFLRRVLQQPSAIGTTDILPLEFIPELYIWNEFQKILLGILSYRHRLKSMSKGWTVPLALVEDRRLLRGALQLLNLFSTP